MTDRAPTSSDTEDGSGHEPIRVVLCDDVPAIRAFVRLELENHADLQVVGEASDGNQAVELVGRLAPDVVVLDLSMPNMDGLEALERLRIEAPGTRVVVFSGFDADRMARKALERGAAAYITKGSPLPALLGAVREAAAGTAA